MNALLQGFLVSGGLIVAIGAQNAFVLKQGLRWRWRSSARFFSRSMVRAHSVRPGAAAR